jgi:ADP-heptose:LPS heptosyltransferase
MEWYPERFQAVVDALKGEFNFVQVGGVGDPALRGVLDLRGKTSLRESAAVVARSLTFLGKAGFLMNVARAVGTRSVIVYGGREMPEETGYAGNENLYSPLGCAPCWLIDGCPYDRECMKMITVEQVIAAVRRQAGRVGAPWAAERAVIPEASA